MRRHRDDIGHFIRFLVVGGLSTAINYAVFLGLLRGLGVVYPLASACGFISGVFAGFPLNKAWTYRHASSTTAALFYKYVFVYLVSLGLSLFALWLLVGVAHLDARIANALVIILTTGTNFIGTKFFAFREKMDITQ